MGFTALCIRFWAEPGWICSPSVCASPPPPARARVRASRQKKEGSFPGLNVPLNCKTVHLYTRHWLLAICNFSSFFSAICLTVVRFPASLALCNLVSWSCSVAGPAGSTVVLKYAEVLRSDGSVSMEWCGGEGDKCVCSGINCANQTDSFTLRGTSGGEEYTPSFTYHGFRYVQVEGWPLDTPPTMSTLTALFVHTAVEPTGNVTFNASLDILNRIQVCP